MLKLTFHKELTAIIFTLLISMVFSCSLYAQTCTFDGSWKSNWGIINLQSNGRKLEGNYSQTGHISGSFQGYVFQGKWWEGPSYNPPNHGGEVIFYISPDCKKLMGDWRYGDNAHNKEWYKHDWNADRLTYSVPSNRAPTDQTVSDVFTAPYKVLCEWEGNWKTPWGTLNMHQVGSDIVKGSYEHKNGQIEGKIVGNKLIGIWGQAPTYAPVYDSGDFLFTISPDCQSFTGDWRYGYKKHANQWQRSGWNGVRY